MKNRASNSDALLVCHEIYFLICGRREYEEAQDNWKKKLSIEISLFHGFVLAC